MSESGSSSASHLKPGARLAHYQVENELGEGAMGVVYRAHDLALDRAVALKVLRPEVADNTATVERFAREARAAARVNHENLAHIYFVGEQDGVRFFAMELVPGEDLEELIRLEGPLDVDDAVDILLQAARGMSAAHKAGVVHRDLKPSNLIRRPDGRVKVTDFGLSKSLDRDTDPGTTHAGQVLGTPTYMSPEQCRGLKVDARTDVYALGLTAYFLLTGDPAYPGPSLGQIINDQINTPLPKVAKVRPDVPEAVDTVLARICAKNRDDRTADMDTVVELLESIRPKDIEPAAIAARGAAVLIDGIVALIATAVILVPVFLLAGEAIDLEWGPFFGFMWLGAVLGPELLWRRTFGKWMLDLEITREDGMQPNPRTLLLRFVYRYPATFLWVLLALWAGSVLIGNVVSLANTVQFVLIASGVLAYFLTGGLTLSDILTSTRVVYSRPAADRRVARFKERRAARKAKREKRRRSRESVDPTRETRIVDRSDGSTQA